MRANRMLVKARRILACVAMPAALSCSCAAGQTPQPAARVIEILADHDSRYKMAGEKQPMITVKAGEPITLRITAKNDKHVKRDGATHGSTLLHAKDRRTDP